MPILEQTKVNFLQSNLRQAAAWLAGAAIVVLAVPALAAFQDVYNDSNLLTANENAVLAQMVSNGTLKDETGSYAIIFPNDQAPIAGVQADQIFRSGQIKIVTFSALPNTLLGSMNIGKQIAQVNQMPVLAVHTGYGDIGVFTEGPTAFYLERLANMAESVTTLGGNAIVPLMKLLKSTPAGNFTELNFVAYCLGAYKAAQVGWQLETANPQLLAKTNLLTLGLGVFHSTHFKSVYELAGNRDQFGRINSTNLWETDIVIGKDHLIRAESPRALPIPPLYQVSTLRDRQLLRSENLQLETFSDSDLQVATGLLADQITNFQQEIDEATSINDNGITDYIHWNKLNWELGRATRNYYQMAAAQANRASDQVVAQQHLARAQTEDSNLQQYKNNMTALLLTRTGITDNWEYSIWSLKTNGGNNIQ